MIFISSTIMAEITKNDNPKYAWYVLYVLAGVQMFNFIDRQILVVIQELIKKDLNLSDGQLGLLTDYFCFYPISKRFE